MSRGGGAQVAGRRISNRRALAISAASRAGRQVGTGVQLDVRLQKAHGVRRRRGLFVFQRVLLNRAVILAEVVDARIGLRGGAGLHEIGNCDRGQQTNDGDDDHNFHEREPRLVRCSDFHTTFYFFLARRERRNRRVNIMTLLVHGLPVTSAGKDFSSWDANPLQATKKGPGLSTPSLWKATGILRKLMGRDATAGRIGYRRARCIGPTAWAMRNITMGIKLYVRLDIVQRIGGSVRFSVLGGPGLEGSVHLLQVVDTTCLLRRCAGFYEVGNRDGGQ